MTMAFFEPDPTFTNVTKAWLCANMFLKNSIGSALKGQRELTRTYFSVFSRLFAARAPSVPGYLATTCSSVLRAASFWPDSS